MIDFHPHPTPCYRCYATAWESTGEIWQLQRKPHERIECVFCGVGLLVETAGVPVASRRQADTATEFRFQFGRFKGLTFAEADAEPNGRRYLETLRDTNEKLKDRITEYLAHAAPSA